jgi:gentisate 1,2-dioxygenase
MLHTELNAAIADRARFVSVEDGFNIKRPPLEPRAFNEERDRALDPSGATGMIPCDMSDVLMTPHPATTPLLLAKFLHLRAGEDITARLRASGEIYYVLRGRGWTSQAGGETVAWGKGDIFCLAGGAMTSHRAVEDSVLYAVTDEPLLAFSGVEPASLAESPLEMVHYPAELIERELAGLFRRNLGPDTPGRALFLSSRKMEGSRTCTPALTLTLNAVLPGERQPPHRHNAAALVFIIKGGPVHSLIGGRQLPWEEGAVLLTPPNAVHSHENVGNEAAVALIVQDGALHYHCRTMGFEFA